MWATVSTAIFSTPSASRQRHILRICAFVCLSASRNFSTAEAKDIWNSARTLSTTRELPVRALALIHQLQQTFKGAKKFRLSWAVQKWNCRILREVRSFKVWTHFHAYFIICWQWWNRFVLEWFVSEERQKYPCLCFRVQYTRKDTTVMRNADLQWTQSSRYNSHTTNAALWM